MAFEKLEKLNTFENAKAWKATDEKFIFCLDLLELSLIDDGDGFCDLTVNSLEDLFEKTLDRPEPGKLYALTGGRKTPSIMAGNSWTESEVKK